MTESPARAGGAWGPGVQAPRAVAPGDTGAVAAQAIGRLAIGALYREAALAPKPGLVSPRDSGSHRDMDFRTFVRSLAALRGSFPALAALGAAGAGFAALQDAGREAEARMLAATDGVNTHRGAIFNLGLLCAAAGRLAAQHRPLHADALCDAVQTCWGPAILESGRTAAASHGREMARRHGSGGARAEAAGGFATVRALGLPALRSARAATGDGDAAAVQALFALIAGLEDTNLLWRGGPAGLRFAQAQARAFLTAGGVLAADWRARAQALHAAFVARRLSPGGSADLLGVTLFLDAF